MHYYGWPGTTVCSSVAPGNNPAPVASNVHPHPAVKKAVQIMTHEDVSLTEVMYRIGIQTQSYFTKAFKKEFGKTPTQFMQEIKRV